MHDEIEQCLETALRELSALSVEENITDKKPSLQFPFKHGSRDRRVSEHEALLLFCAALLKKNIPFSVETPTINSYPPHDNPKGERRPGRIDVCVFNRKGKRFANLEFKANNNGRLYRDFDKLTGEGIEGWLVHIADETTEKSRETLMQKYKHRMSGKKTNKPLFCRLYDLAGPTLYAAELPKKGEWIIKWKQDPVGV